MLSINVDDRVDMLELNECEILNRIYALEAEVASLRNNQHTQTAIKKDGCA